MKEHAGFFLPDDDQHFTTFKQLAEYQEPIREAALPYLKGTELAVDGGAHVGIFSRWLEARFDRVLAIEPDAENHRCLVRNAGDKTTPVRLGLGHVAGWARIEQGGVGNSGDKRLARSGAPPSDSDERFVRLMTLDKLLAKRLPGVPVRLLKLDLQGGELVALQGAADTLHRWAPVVIIEQTADIPPHLRPARELARLGYHLRETIRDDQIWSVP